MGGRATSPLHRSLLLGLLDLIFGEFFKPTRRSILILSSEWGRGRVKTPTFQTSSWHIVSILRYIRTKLFDFIIFELL
jgi:hypothetical protein